MYKILIAGAGNIGSRHLQAFAHTSLSMQLFVVDPNKSSLEIAETRWSEAISGKATAVNVSFLQSVEEVPDAIDVAIIATNSVIRKRVFEQLIHERKVTHVVFEKFLFQTIAEYESVDVLLKSNGIKGWVNCPRRMYDIYSTLKNLLNNETSFEFQVTGSNWGLGCNSIHYLDLFSFLSGKTEFFVSDVFVDDAVLTSKREGYIEFTGSLFGRDAENNTFVITSYQKENIPIYISINTNGYSILIQESGAASKVSVTSKKDNLSSEIIPFSMPFQSQLTHLFIERLVTEGTCLLSTYEDSRNLHEPILSAFIHFLQKKSTEIIATCPIT